jgi:NADH-quinone oxidoreductase subunit L
MTHLIHLFLWIPFAGFVITLLIPRKNEQLISRIAISTTLSTLLLAVGFTAYWIWNGAIPFNLVDLSIYQDKGYHFFLDFYFDKIGATFLLVGSLISFLVVYYSSFYMHRETGFKRFFNTELFFFLGYTWTILSGNFETLFIGWEILGISSFLLIAFYRLRYLPVRNALKVFTIYRIGDVGILLAMWMSHHLWHANITFARLSNADLVESNLLAHPTTGLFISMMVLVAALAKSAQFPFTAWLPRAMEGPTPSSATFYGSLSVHIGAFLLLRMHPFWAHQWVMQLAIGGLGVLTALLATLIARVQPTIKGKIAYSSAAQIGIIFLEIALGLETLALIHFTGNALLRMYQLLVSPSVVTYMVREQFYSGNKLQDAIRNSEKPGSLGNKFYLLAMQEFHLDSVIFKLVFSPLKRMRKLIGFLTLKSVMYILLPVYLVGLVVANYELIDSHTLNYSLAVGSGLLALLMVSKSYNERTSSRLAWVLVVFAHFFIDLAVTFNDHFNLKEAGLYLSGVLVSGIVGFFTILYVRKHQGGGIGLHRYHGLVARYPKSAFIFFLSSLGIAGFPITTTFFGEDVILSHIHEDQFILAAFVSLTFIINGMAVLRLYARIFLGYIKRGYQTEQSLTI